MGGRGSSAVRNEATRVLSGKYRYHATTPLAVPSIARTGLEPREGMYGPAVYMASSEQSALDWTAETSTGGEVLMRVSTRYLSKTDYGDVEDEYASSLGSQGWTEQGIPPQYIEVKTTDGNWIKVTDAAVSYMRGVPRIIRKPRK